MNLRILSRWRQLFSRATKTIVEDALPVPRTIMAPISFERAEWIKARLQVLGQIRKTLTRRQAFYAQTIGVDQHTFMQTQMAIRAEELLLTVELDVLISTFAVAP